MTTTATHKGRRWNPEAILCALRCEHERTGRAPTARSWITATTEHPSAATVRNHFRTWLVAIEKAGLANLYTVEQAIWSRENTLAALNRWASENGNKYPRKCDWEKRGEYHPNCVVVRNLFKTWAIAISKAAELAGTIYETPKRGGNKSAHRSKARDYTHAQILAGARRYKRTEKAWPKSSDWMQGDTGYPTYAHVRKHFDSWPAMILEAGKKAAIIKLSAKRNPMPAHIRNLVYERDHNCCQNPYCDGRDSRLSVDHIIPVCIGGTNDLDNLQTMCGTCNSRKGAMDWSVFLSRESDRTKTSIAA